MKTKYTRFRRNGIYYSQDSATGQQKSLRIRDKTEALQLIHACNEAQRQPVLNLQLARAYLTARDPAFVERTWQMVMDQLQARGKDASRERYATVFKSHAFDGLRHKRLLETTADDFLALFKDGKVSIIEFLKRRHNFAVHLGWIAVPIVAPCLWPNSNPETGAAQSDAVSFKAEDIDWQTRTISYFRQKTGSLAQFTISMELEKVLPQLGVSRNPANPKSNIPCYHAPTVTWLGCRVAAICRLFWPAAASKAMRARRTIFCGVLPGDLNQAIEFGGLFGGQDQRQFGASHDLGPGAEKVMGAAKPRLKISAEAA